MHIKRALTVEQCFTVDIIVCVLLKDSGRKRGVTKLIINSVLFNCELADIISELQSQLVINNIKLLQKTKDGPDNIQVQCPYHKNGQERRPSAGIRKSDGLFHCMACGETHSLQEMISFCFGHYDDMLGSFGWKWLLKNFATVEVEVRKDVDIDFSRNLRLVKQVNYVSEEELDGYRYTHPYMYERGLTDEVIELFDIGYDSNSDCITFPVRDVRGNTLFVARRSVKTKFFNYPQGVEKPLYGLYEYVGEFKKIAHFGRSNGKSVFLNRLNEVVVTESMLDALSFWTVGKYAVALNGLGNELQFKQLRELQCRKLILATDNDSAGMKARKRIRENIKNKIITEYIFPEGRKDANECTKQELSDLVEVF